MMMEEAAMMKERPDGPDEPAFQQLFVSVPVGLSLQFLPETSVGIPFDTTEGRHRVCVNNRQTDRQTDTRTDRQTKRQTDSQANRHICRQTDRQTVTRTDRDTEIQTGRQTGSPTERQTCRQKDRHPDRQTE